MNIENRDKTPLYFKKQRESLISNERRMVEFNYKWGLIDYIHTNPFSDELSYIDFIDKNVVSVTYVHYICIAYTLQARYIYVTSRI